MRAKIVSSIFVGIILVAGYFSFLGYSDTTVGIVGLSMYGGFGTIILVQTIISWLWR